MADRQYVRTGNGLSNKDSSSRERVQAARAKAREAARLETRVTDLEKQVAELQRLIKNGSEV